MEDRSRIYLDTNLIIGWFKHRLEEERRGLKFIVPERLEKVQKLNRELVVSYLVKAEVSRYLKSEWQLNAAEIYEKWEEFRKEMEIKLIELKKFEVDLKEIDFICSEVPLKKEGTIPDIIHLKISKTFNLKFLTSETKLKSKLSRFFDNIVHISEIL